MATDQPAGLQSVQSGPAAPSADGDGKGNVFDVRITFMTDLKITPRDLQDAIVRAFGTRAFGIKARYEIKPFEAVQE